MFQRKVCFHSLGEGEKVGLELQSYVFRKQNAVPKLKSSKELCIRLEGATWNTSQWALSISHTHINNNNS